MIPLSSETPGPVITDQQTNNGGGQISIKEILEKVNLFSMLEEETTASPPPGSAVEGTPTKEMDPQNAPDPSSAYLGPKFWNKQISLNDLKETDAMERFPVINFEEFLQETDLHLDPTDKEERNQTEQENNDRKRKDDEKEDDEDDLKRSNKLPKGSNSFLYAESKRARLEREAEERRRRREALDIAFTAEELCLATVPGTNFDPTQRTFSVEELKPQPIIRKRKKDYVPQEKKDERYWDKRIKNNVAARRSREARRLKENQIALRAAFLERENSKLKDKVKEFQDENESLKKTVEILRGKLRAFENCGSH